MCCNYRRALVAQESGAPLQSAIRYTQKLLNGRLLSFRLSKSHGAVFLIADRLSLVYVVKILGTSTRPGLLNALCVADPVAAHSGTQLQIHYTDCGSTRDTEVPGIRSGSIRLFPDTTVLSLLSF